MQIVPVRSKNQLEHQLLHNKYEEMNMLIFLGQWT